MHSGIMKWNWNGDQILNQLFNLAISVNNNTIFIVFGKDGLAVPTTSLLILNTTNPSNITLLENYIDINNASVAILNLDSRPSSGAIAGIVVGSIAGVNGTFSSNRTFKLTKAIDLGFDCDSCYCFLVN